jgi:F0F1-type ATP synthase assembly protein I
MKKPSSKATKEEQNRKSALNDFGRYSSLAFQMIAIILAGVFGGIKLDQVVRWEFPVFTLVLTILAVFMSMYYAVKDLIRNK